MTPEAKILAHTKKECKRLGLRFFRNSPRQGVEGGWPDVIILGPVGGVGLTLWLETKSPGKPLKPLQARRKEEIEERGGLAHKADNIHAVTFILERFRSACLAELD